MQKTRVSTPVWNPPPLVDLSRGFCTCVFTQNNLWEVHDSHWSDRNTSGPRGPGACGRACLALPCPGCGWPRRGSREGPWPLPRPRSRPPRSTGPPVPAGSPAPCRAAGGPAASWGSWSAAATPCPDSCHYSSSAAGYWPRWLTAPKGSQLSLTSEVDKEGGVAPTNSRPRPGPLPPDREGAAPNAWRAKPTPASGRAPGPRLRPGFVGTGSLEYGDEPYGSAHARGAGKRRGAQRGPGSDPHPDLGGSFPDYEGGKRCGPHHKLTFQSRRVPFKVYFI